jgi:hypothetical protein
MPFSIIEHGLIHDASSAVAHEKIAFTCGLRQTSSGSIFSTCQLASAKSAPDSHLGLFRSQDQGRTWRRIATQIPNDYAGVRGSIAAGEIVETSPGRLMLVSTWYDRTDPERPLFDPVTEGLLKSKILKSFSDDDGETWSEWEEIPLQGLTGAAISGGALQWNDQSVGVVFESFKHFDETEDRPQAAWVLRSFDGGKTFPQLTQVASDPTGRTSYWDERLCAGPTPGEYLGLFWTHDREAKIDLSVHWKRGFCIGEKSSQVPRPTGMDGQISALTLLPDGSILSCVVHRNRPSSLSLWHSRDGGETWPLESKTVIYDHEEKARLSQGASEIDFAQYWEDMGRWTFGHPALLAISQTEVLLVYYAGVPGALSMHWALLRNV